MERAAASGVRGASPGHAWPSPLPGRAGAAFDGVLRGGAILLALQVGNVVLGFTAQVLLARWLGDAEFGVYAWTWAWANLLAVPAGLGLSTAVLRFMPTYAADADPGRLHALVRWTGRTVFLAGLCTGALCGAVVLAARNAIPAPYLVPLWLGFALVPLLALSTLRINHGHALGRPAAAYLPWVVGSNVGLIAGGAMLMVAGVRLDATMVLAVALIALAGIAIVQWRAVSRLMTVPARIGRPEPRRWLRVSMPLLASSLLFTLLERADLVLVGLLLGPQHAGVYGAAARTALLASFGVTAITTLATPRIATLHASGRRDELQAFARRVGRWTFWPALAAALALALFGGSVLSVFGPGFRDGWACLALLAAAQTVPAAAGLAPHLLNMTGHEVAGAAVMAVAVVVSLGLGLVLIPRIGITGAAIATSASMVTRAVGHALLVRHRLGLRTFTQFAPAGAP